MSTPPDKLPIPKHKSKIAEVLLSDAYKAVHGQTATEGRPEATKKGPETPQPSALRDPVLTWAKPAPIVVGTPLGPVQLCAVEAGGARLKFTPDTGAVLDAKDGHTLRVDVDDPRFKPGFLLTTIDVKKKVRTLIWEAANPVEVYLKDPIRPDQIKVRFSEGDGTWIAAPKAGDAFPKNTQGLAIAVTAAATDEYDAPEPLSIPVRILLRPQPFKWDQTAKEIKATYGTKLNANLFKAEVPENPKAKIAYTVNGTAVDASTILDAGRYELIATSPGSNQFAPTTLKATLVINQNQPIIDWVKPANIVYGTKLTRADHLRATLKRPAGQDDKLEYDPPEGTELVAGEHKLKATYPGDTNFAKLSATVGITVDKAQQEIDWPQPANLTYPRWLSNVEKTASVKKGNLTGALTYSAVPATVKVGKVKLKVVVPANENYLETSKEVEIEVLPPVPPAKPTPQQKTSAKITPVMEAKVTSAEPKPGSPGKIRGGHSAKILTDTTNYATTSVPIVNDDGTQQVLFKKKLPDGSWSDPKFSTLAPANWNDDAIMGATIEVGKEPAKYTRAKDNATLHTKKVNGVQWDVIKDNKGNVTMSCPTGGPMTSKAAFET